MINDCELRAEVTEFGTQQPKVWRWADLVFGSSRRHIDRDIIPLMLKLSFVHIL